MIAKQSAAPFEPDPTLKEPAEPDDCDSLSSAQEPSVGLTVGTPKAGAGADYRRRRRTTAVESKLHEAMISVREQFGLQPTSGRLVRVCSPLGPDDAVFELSTEVGTITAIRMRNGTHAFQLQKHLFANNGNTAI